MSLLHRLSRFSCGEDTRRSAFLRALQDSYADCSQRAQLLSCHADLAPQEASARALRQLAEEEREALQRLDTELRAQGLPVPSGTSGTERTVATNHWARLVQDLELHRTAARNLYECATRFADLIPERDSVFAEIGRREAEHCTTLRGLIARADPQALD